MPIAVGDLIEIKTVMNDATGGEAVNVYHYEAASNNYLAGAYADAWLAQVWPSLKNIIHYQTTLIRIEARNLFQPDELAVRLVNETGADQSTYDSLPSFVGYGVTLLHDRPGTIRPGSKRIPGVSESYNAPGGSITANFYSYAATQVATLSDPLKEAIGGLLTIARPVVVRRVAEIIGGVTRYRMPVTLAEKIVGYVFDAVLARYLTSQNTRKRGRGV